MEHKRTLLKALNVEETSSSARAFASRAGIDGSRLLELHREGKFPTGDELDRILATAGLTEIELRLSTGHITSEMLDLLSKDARVVANLISKGNAQSKSARIVESFAFQTKLGSLYHGDCLDLLRSLSSDTVDVVFADPPFNLKKLYPSKIDDDLTRVEYLKWCEAWISECCRVLKPGGRLFLWNIPRWNVQLAAMLENYLHFQHWIATDIKYSLPIQGRLYPSHYSLLYYTKGRIPACFHPDRLPMATCPSCYRETKDYGGYKNKMNPAGINLTDVWLDIPPVRHQKYKARKDANELSIKLLDRVIEMSSNPGDLILDPFGGAGTTFIAAELKGRRWIGSEIGPVQDIEDRFDRIADEAAYLGKIRQDLNSLFPDAVYRSRKARGIWTPEDFAEENTRKKSTQAEIFE